MKLLFLSIILFLVTACATSYEPTYYYNEIRVINNSQQILRNLSIRVPATGGEFSCGNVAPRGLCSNRFGKRKYHQNPIQVEWSYGQNPVKTQEFIVEVPVSFTLGHPIQGVIEVSDSGEMRAYFRQEAIFR